MPAEIRSVTPADLLGWTVARRTTFLMPVTPPDDEITWLRSRLDPARTTGAWDDGQCVATLRSFPTSLTVPGGDTVAADALTNVTVAATHRRQGLLRGMLGASLQQAQERGEVVSVLRAAEWPIYGRFGYWPSSECAAYRIECDRGATLIGADDGLRLRTLTSDEAVQHGLQVYAAMRTTATGCIDRALSQWQSRLGLGGASRHYDRDPVCIAAFDESGTAQGLLTWTANDTANEHDPVDVVVRDLIAGTIGGYRALWSYLLHLDLVRAVLVEEAAVDQPLTWLLGNGRALVQTRREDDLWLRMLDVPAALSARRYGATDRLALQIIDTDIGGWGDGTYILDGGPDHAQCDRSGSVSADLTLSQRALAALYLGGYSVHSQQVAGLIEEHTPGAARRLAAMMHTDQRPWNATPF